MKRDQVWKLQNFEPRSSCHIIGTATALIGGALIGAAGSVIAGNKAAGATDRASQAAISEQDKALQQQKELSQPYRDLGTSAIPTYQDLLTGGGDPAKVQKTLESLPGYQFARDQGIEAAKRANPNLSGNQVVAAETFGANLADTTYSQRLQELLDPIKLGQAAAAGQAANVGQAATNVGNIAMSQGATQAGIDANTIAGVSKAIGNAGNQYVTLETLKGLNSPGVPTYSVPGDISSAINTPVASVPTYLGG